jgi:hypothetical protein
MSLGDVIEGEDGHTEAAKEVATEDDERVEGEL